MSFGNTPVSTTSLGANQFPVSAVAVPGEAAGNLTALEGGPESTDSNGNKTAPASVYMKDGNDVTQGLTTDGGVIGDAAGTVSGKLRGLLTSTVGLLTSNNVEYQNKVLALKPIRYYRLNEPSGAVATDLGSQAQNGTLHGGITLGGTGLVSNDPATSELFNGSTGYISLPTSGLPSGAAPFTLGCVIYATSYPTGYYPIILNLGNTSTNNCIVLYYHGDTGFIQAGTFVSADIHALSAPAVNTRYTCYVTYDGHSLSFYVNGVLQGTKTITLNISYGAAQIGADSGLNYFWGQSVQEAVFFNTCLSQSQISSLDRAAHDSGIFVKEMFSNIHKVLYDVWDSTNHRLFVADIEPSGYIALSSPPTQTNAGTETVLTFSSQVNRVEIYNGSGADFNYAFDATCTAGSLVLPAGYQLDKAKKITAVHILTSTAINVNGTTAGNIVVLGSL